MFLATLDLDCPCAVQVTASHHPYHRNGLKFFTKDGGLDGPDIAEILEGRPAGGPARAGGPRLLAAGGPHGRLRPTPSGSRLRKGWQPRTTTTPLRAFTSWWTPAMAPGAFTPPQVLAPLGADVSGSQFLEPDGMFPNHVPNPEDKAAMDAISQAVVKKPRGPGGHFRHRRGPGRRRGQPGGGDQPETAWWPWPRPSPWRSAPGAPSSPTPSPPTG